MILKAMIRNVDSSFTKQVSSGFSHCTDNNVSDIPDAYIWIRYYGKHMIKQKYKDTSIFYGYNDVHNVTVSNNLFKIGHRRRAV